MVNLYPENDSRFATAASEAAGEIGVAQASAAAQASRTALAARSYALARINVIILASAREKPDARVLEAEFCFEQCTVGCAVIYACISANNQQSAHGWLFESEEPDLNRDNPVAELSINSTGGVLVSPGCSADYETMRDRIANLQSSASSRAGDSPPASRTDAADDRDGECASAEGGPAQPDDVTGTMLSGNGREQNAASQSNGRSRERAGVIVLGTAGAILTLSALVAYLHQAAPSARADDAAPSAIRAIPVAPEHLPPPTIVPQPAVSADKFEPSRFRVEVSAVPPVRKPPKREKQQAGEQGPGGSAGVGVAGAGMVSEPVLEERGTIPSEAWALAETGVAHIRTEQAQCSQEGFWNREICKEEVRWNHCHPDKWNKVPECAVQKFDYSTE